LLDFARIIGEFDKRGVSFVSVTQQFNTRAPVGRLTLNILLSFAVFEREIIAERTRDKKAGAKRKGMWTGGYVPLGYDLDPRGGRLIINKEEAAQVQTIFEQFAKLRSIEATLAELRRRGWKTKSWITEKNKRHVGHAFTEGSLVRLLSNALYAGLVSYGGESFRGVHKRIVDARLWKRVQGTLPAAIGRRVRKERNKNGALLKGLLFCAVCEKPMVHTYTAKGERRYRYYLCRARDHAGCSGQSLAAHVIENSVLEQLDQLARQPGRSQLRKRLKPLGGTWRSQSALDLLEPLRAIIARVSCDAASGAVSIRFRGSAEKRDA
jgi:site-specific DNA recombinase